MPKLLDMPLIEGLVQSKLFRLMRDRQQHFFLWLRSRGHGPEWIRLVARQRSVGDELLVRSRVARDQVVASSQCGTPPSSSSTHTLTVVKQQINKTIPRNVKKPFGRDRCRKGVIVTRAYWY